MDCGGIYQSISQLKAALINGARAYKTIVSLRAKIADILERFEIAVLPAEEWQKPAPWLRGTEETLIGLDGKAMRVLDAFFFESL